MYIADTFTRIDSRLMVIFSIMPWESASTALGLQALLVASAWFGAQRIGLMRGVGSASDKVSSPKEQGFRFLLTNRAWWASAAAHFSDNNAGYVLGAWLPTFMKDGLGFRAEDLGFLTALTRGISVVTGLGSGLLADFLIGRGLPVLTVRRIMTIADTLVPAALLVIVPFLGPGARWAAIALVLLTKAVQSAAGAGYTSSFADNFPGTMASYAFGASNVLATVPAIVCVPFAGALASTLGWWSVFVFVSFVYVCGAYVYLSWSSAASQIPVPSDRDGDDWGTKEEKTELLHQL